MYDLKFQFITINIVRFRKFQIYLTQHKVHIVRDTI